MDLISKICITRYMTEQKLVNPSLKVESAVEESGISWKELQGLSWIFSEDDY